MYAIVRTGGKQYRVEAGRAVTVERLPAEEGATVELSDVLLIADDGEVTVGRPVIEGARVRATVEGHGRGKKVVVFKYKAKVRTRKKTGHRQPFTRLLVTEILRPGEQPKIAKERPRRGRKAAEAEAAPVEAASGVEEAAAKRRPRRKAEETSAVEAPKAEAPTAEEAPKRRTRRKDKPATGEAEPEQKATRPRTRRKKSEETE